MTSAFKILLSNVGYARGINGCLGHHMRYAHRHIFCPEDVQREVMNQLASLIAEEDPDICCLVEIDNGKLTSSNFSQLEALVNKDYAYFDIENKYGKTSLLRSLIFTKGKSNAFIAKANYEHEKVYFDYGVKKLIYKIKIKEGLTLFFAHYSLNKSVREKQILQTDALIESTPGEVIVLGDFNVLSGLQELTPLLEGKELLLMNDAEQPTFTFHKRELVLDLCLCSKEIAQRTELRVIPQPYSDHAALIATVRL